MVRLGVMGGTFDPLHTAHLVMAEMARTAFALDKVLFIPAGQPPHKSERRVTDAEHRYAMTLIGTASNPHFEASRIEIEREGPSYSADTIRLLKVIYVAKAEIYFIVGADEALDVPNWHEAESLPGLVKFLVIPRPGFDLSTLRKGLPDRFVSIMHEIPIAPMVISATDIRARVASGESIRYLVPESVEAYIRKHRLYARNE